MGTEKTDDGTARPTLTDSLTSAGRPASQAPLDPEDLVGRRLEHFHIDARVGKGGMGVVYRAFDDKLHRQVAVKVLTARHFTDERGVRRLFREARLVARLAHPCIAAIYEVHDDHDPAFLVMELVHGETLRDRMNRGPLERSEAIRIGRALGEALAVAHAAGVVHRDVKPSNVMLTPDGSVKLLDFGVAKAVWAPRLEANAASLAHVTDPSIEGRIVGTPAYMSPEQAMGEAIDARSDLFSLGVVLYEMLSGGEPPFERGNALRTAAAISRDEPCPLVAIRPGIGRQLAAVVHRCLAKRRDDRFATAGELVAALAAAEPAPRRVRRALGLAIAGAVTIGAAVLITSAGSRAPAPLDDAGAAAGLVARTLRRELAEERTALARDGRTVAVYRDGALSLESLDGSAAAQPIALPAALGRPRAFDTFGFAPDGQSLLVAGGPKDHETAWLLPLNGAPAIALGAIPLDLGAISPDGRRIVFRGLAGVYVRALAGGEPVRILATSPGEDAYAFAWSPGGDEIAAIVGNSACSIDAGLRLVSADGARDRRVDAAGLVSTNCSVSLAWPTRDTIVYAEQPHAGTRSASIVELALSSLNRRVIATVPDAEIRAVSRAGASWVVETLTASSTLRRMPLDPETPLPAGLAAQSLPAEAGLLGVFGDGSALLRVLTPDQLVDLVVQSSTVPPRTTMLARATPRIPAGRVAITASDEVLFWRMPGASGSAQDCRLMSASRAGVERPLPVPAGSEPLRCASPIRCARVAPDRCAVMEAVTGQSRFSMFDPRTGARSAVFFRIPGDYAHWALSSDGESLVLAGDKLQSVRVVSTRTGDARTVPVVDSGVVEDVSFTPDGREILATVADSVHFLIVRAELAGRSRVFWAGEPWSWPAVPCATQDGIVTFYVRHYADEFAELRPASH